MKEGYMLRVKKIRFKFRCKGCHKVVTEVIYPYVKGHKKYCRKCNPEKIWFKRNRKHYLAWHRNYYQKFKYKWRILAEKRKQLRAINSIYGL